MAEINRNFIDPLPWPAHTNTLPESTPEGHWKHLPPYEVQSEEQFGPIKWRGKCFCGKITYLLKREKTTQCQILPLSRVPGYPWSSPSDHVLPTKVSCANCRTPIMDEGRNMCLIFPQLIEFEGSSHERREKREAFKPTCHIFYKSRTLDLPDGLPKWSGMENASDQMDDHGNRIGNL
ncbi:Glutathione-dependent formaldehyde-activating enzyme/centromere protein V [Penicillium expansum]|nr:Glutathione-dependent formaldehyde-activating enzyme/centromere protein V [Penicillium expansum]